MQQSIKTGPEYLRDLWRDLCGLPEKKTVSLPSIDELRETEWSPEFEQLMRNRMIMGAFRYGRLRSESKPVYDRMNSIRQRLPIYEATGNLEVLVDIANMALLEFVEGEHPNRHLKAVDDGVHTQIKGEV